MKTKTLFITSLLLIVGCSKPVEDSTLINKVGLMYLPDSDSPYTGEVFTNYDTGEKEYQGTYENGLLVTYSYLNKDGSVKEPVNGETLIDRGGLLYEVNGQKLYTGDVFELYKDGSRKSTGSLKGGKKDRLWTEWYENGEKRLEGTYKDGKEDGLWTHWDNDGTKYEGKVIRKDDEDGTFFYWYDNKKTKIFSHKTYKDGKDDGLWTRWYENGQKWKERTYKDGRQDSLMTYWDNDGKVYKGKFMNMKWNDIDFSSSNGNFFCYEKGNLGLVNVKNGELDGLQTFWYENGQKRFEVTFKDGKYISEERWEKDGSVKE